MTMTQVVNDMWAKFLEEEEAKANDQANAQKAGRPGWGNVRVDYEAQKGAETVLQEAQRLVYGDRQAAYGHPYDDYTRTGRMWEAILGLEPGAIPPHIACLMMAAVKISREVNGHKRDNCTDGAGYFACADMCAERQAELDASNGRD